MSLHNTSTSSHRHNHQGRHTDTSQQGGTGWQGGRISGRAYNGEGTSAIENGEARAAKASGSGIRLRQAFC
jgi:hypothetical protein